MNCFSSSLPRRLMQFLIMGMMFGLAEPASAEMVLSQVIVDFAPSAMPHQDIEVWNSGAERIYVVAEPSEIVSAGKVEEQRVQNPDPQKLGLLVTPNRLILEPGERKLIRVAAIAARTDEERIYRIAVKPVVGDITAPGSGLKILVGYDVLVIFRPLTPRSAVTAMRGTDTLTLHNDGNTNVELFDGKQCDTTGKNCTSLPPKRLYAGANWEQPSPRSAKVTYSIKTGETVAIQTF